MRFLKIPAGSTGQGLRGVSLLLALATLTLATEAAEPPRQHYIMYVGTYTGEESKGIYAYRYDAKSGEAVALGLAAEAKNPTFLAVHPSHKFLYAANETNDFDGAGSGAASAFAIDRATGKLTLLNQVSSRGGGACAITVDRAGRNVLVANYGGGSVAVLPIAKDGRLREASAFVEHTGSGADPSRQEGPHAHSVDVSPDQRFALAADLGLDQILVYRFDSKRGTLAPNDPPFAKLPPKWGPRHLAFHPDGRFVYLINELASQVSAFSYNPRAGTLTEIQSLSTLPPDFKGESYTAEIAVHPSGRFLYGSNRGHNSIAVFEVNPAKGTVVSIEAVPTGGDWPRHFEIDPTGRFMFVANQNSGDIRSFRIDPDTGRLKARGQVLRLPSPVCIKFVPVN